MKWIRLEFAAASAIVGDVANAICAHFVHASCARLLLIKSLLSATKTDLALLLKCLKFQMKCPDLQKQALLTIRSICENRGKLILIHDFALSLQPY